MAGEREQGGASAGGSGLDRFRYEYGAQPLHLIATVASLLLSGYGLLRLNDLSSTGRILIWIVAAALLHDLVALPVYSVLMRVAHGTASRAIASRAMALHALNHVRVPAGLSLLLLAVYSPLILRIAPGEYTATTGLDVSTYLGRWLLISAGLFLISGAVYAVRLRTGVAEPGPVAAPVGAGETVAPPALPWRIGARVVLAGAALVTLWVAAALVIGLITNGI